MKGFIFFLASLFTILSCFGQTSSLEVSPKFKKSIQNLAKEIKSLDSEGFSDLLFLKDVISNDKQYVFIGESSHYTAEQYLLKTQLIKYLHSKYDFNLLAMESNMGTTSFLNTFKNTSPDIDSIVPYFNYYFPCIEMIPMIKYILKTNLISTGFDIWTASPKIWYPAVRKYFKIPDSLYFKDSIFYNYLILKSDTIKNNESFNSIKKYNPEKILQELPSTWKSSIKNIVIDTISDPIKKCIAKSILIRADMLNCILTKRISITIRDSIMSQNLLWIMQNFPNEKIIFWAHNRHIEKVSRNFKESGFSKGMSGLEGNMIKYLHDTIIAKSYFLGIYGYEGCTSFNEKGYKLKKNRKNMLGSIILKSGYDIAFCNFSNQQQCKENDWMFHKIKATGEYKYKIIPIKTYDGVIIIKKVSPINYINRNN